jgi:hypothetical protein
MFYETTIFGKGNVKTHDELAQEERERTMAEIQALQAQIAAFRRFRPRSRRRPKPRSKPSR